MSLEQPRYAAPAAIPTTREAQGAIKPQVGVAATSPASVPLQHTTRSKVPLGGDRGRRGWIQ